MPAQRPALCAKPFFQGLAHYHTLCSLLAAENVGAIGITGVGSRRVIQTGAVIIIFMGVIG